MRPGGIVDHRFEIVRLAGEGGMGHVFEARDRTDGSTVAVKVLNVRGPTEVGRFKREAAVLADLSHPGIVRYIAHGVTPDDEPFLVMEWLTGETLAQRLRTEGLGVAESVALAARLARALAAVHKKGIVHRDLKPSNVFLAGGSTARPLLIDFGIALVAEHATRLTSTGAMVGTPGYMAPEQARGEPGLDGRVDLFALGCVLFKCLTGADAFAGNDPLSVLLKVVLEEPPRAGALRTGIPPALDALLARMLSKDRTQRVADGDTLAAELDALDPSPLSARPDERPPAREITTNERKLMGLVLVRAAATDVTPTRVLHTANDTTEPVIAPRTQALHHAVERHHGRLEILADDALLVVLTGTGAPTDLAVRAARCALSLHAVLGGAPIGLCTGRAEIEARLPVGELIERAVAFSLQARQAAPDNTIKGSIRLDEVTAGLLGARFDVRAEDGALVLHRERDDAEPVRLLLGKPTSCVGRERELSILEAAFANTAEESMASAVLITAAAGAGKSRLRHELVRRLRDRGEALELWIGHGDPVSAGSAFGLLARAIRNALGLAEGAPAEACRDALRTRTRAMAEPDRVAVFLAELLGAPFPEDASPMLRAARRDPVLMGDQMRRAAEDLVRAACEAGPVVILLEDLHWGDLPTVTFIDAALRNLAELPLLVLALGRPEVHARFPRLWADRAMQVLHLSELPRRAAERLVRQVLGDAAPPDVVKTLVERAEGNAFYLEELIRAVASGKGKDLPETVLAMAQARLEDLDFEVRRLLRAASVFGATFSQAGVEALVGGTPADDMLAQLCAGEVLVRRAGPGETAYAFRHALVREAAYAMLTEKDRTLGHRLAGAWLESTGAGDAMALAEHFERGHAPERAAGWYRRAAEEALAGDDLVAALDRAGRGIACGAGLENGGALRLCQAEAHVWRGEIGEAVARATEAVAALPAGSVAWFCAVRHCVYAIGKLGAFERAVTWAEVASAAPPDEGAESARVTCLSACASNCFLAGRHAVAEALLVECQRALDEGREAIDPQAIGVMHEAEAFRAVLGGDPGAAGEHFDAALEAFEQAGDRRNACASRANAGFIRTQLGDFERAEEVLQAALADTERMGLHEVAANMRQNLGGALVYLGRLDEARAMLDRAMDEYKRQGQPRMEGVTLIYLAKLAQRSDDAAGAERAARAAAELLEIAPSLHAFALAVLAQALLRQGRKDEALSAAEKAFAELSAIEGTLEEGESLVRLVHAEALSAAGRHAEAARALAVAREQLLARAARLRDPAVRERFLTRIPENAGILAAAV